MPWVLVGDETAFSAIDGKVALTELYSSVVRPLRITYSRALTLAWKDPGVEALSSSPSVSPAGTSKTSLNDRDKLLSGDHKVRTVIMNPSPLKQLATWREELPASSTFPTLVLLTRASFDHGLLFGACTKHRLF